MASVFESRKRNTFTSYVAPPLEDVRVTNSDEWGFPNEIRDVYMVKPRLLPNELVAESAPAYMYPSIAPTDTEKGQVAKEAVFGLLSVTNFKLAFVPLQKPTLMRSQVGPDDSSYQEHLILQRNEVTLNNIDLIYHVTENGRRTPSNFTGVNKRKKLIDSEQKVMSSGRIAALHIVCKNFRLLKFSFQNSAKGSRDYGKVIASALARFAYISKHDLSFAYCYREPYFSTLQNSSVTMYTSKNDWSREQIRCGSTEWQVISADSIPQLVNDNLMAPKYTFPSHFVIPKCCPIERFLDISRAFCDSRAAFWVYGYGDASLVRMAELKVPTPDNKFENITIELVRKCDRRLDLHRIQLTECLPSIQEVRRAYVKFRRLCTPDSVQQFLLQDSKFLTLMEKSNWLSFVSVCLKYSCEAAEKLRSGVTCILQETNGRDLCAVISSVTQILLDPFFRTIDGFQSLVQKDWIALEHPFQKRLGHVRPNPAHSEESESPVFLLFLDCVWQLLQQFPDEFEYSQTYLTTLWDSCFLPIFDTFQFNTEAERARAVKDYNLIRRPIWDWNEQFAEKDKIFFTNPFYQRQRPLDFHHVRRSGINLPGSVRLPGFSTPTKGHRHSSINPSIFGSPSVPKDRFLVARHRICDLEIWQQCYFRWMPVLEIQHGGYPQIDLYHRLLLSNIAKLQRCIELQDFEDLPDIYYDITGEINNESIPKNSVETIDGVDVERRIKSNGLDDTSNNCDSTGINAISQLLPSVSSFFPFSTSASNDNSEILLDILTSSNEFLLDGSVMERMSIV